MAILLKWALEDGPEARARIRRNRQPIWLMVSDGCWSDIVLLDADVNKDLIGMDFEEIGRMRSVDP